MPRRPYCVESAAVKVSVDELMTEMLRRVSPETVGEILFLASQGARKRLQEERHNRYKSEKFFRRAAKRMPDIPPHLAAAVGLHVEGELSSPDITVEPAKKKRESPKAYPRGPVTPAVQGRKDRHIDVEETKRTIDVDLQESIPPTDQAMINAFLDDEPTPPPGSMDEFADLLDMPEWEDYEAVFSSYPYVWETVSKGGERRLVLGYASARKKDSDQLVRRNCAYTGPDGIEHPFNDLPSVVGLLKRYQGGVHRHIKVLPYRPGTKVRFWTNVAGVGDREDLYRYVRITEDGLVRVHSRVAFNTNAA